MFGPSRLTHFVTFLALLGPSLAASLYRMDFRTPSEVHADGGLVSFNPHGTGSVVDHVLEKLGHDDPWVSTTSDKKFAAKGATSPGDVYVYKIDPKSPNKLTIKDVDKEFQKVHEKNPHPAEKEFCVQGEIPWANIISWETFNRGKSTGVTTREQFEGKGSPSKSTKSHHKVRSFVA
jgi:hypothetical protein